MTMENLKHVVALLFAMSLFVPVLAQTDLPDPGILPTSPVYPLKKGWERAIDVITFDPESKSQLHYQYALTRLSEANALADLNETQDIPEVIDEYESEMNETETLSNETSDDGNATGTEGNNTQGIGSLVSAFMKQSNMTWEKHLFVLGLVAQKVPPQAALKIERNINRTLERKFSNETLRETLRGKIEGKGNRPSEPKGNKPETAGSNKPVTGKPSDSGNGNGNKGGSAGNSNGGRGSSGSGGSGGRGK